MTTTGNANIPIIAVDTDGSSLAPVGPNGRTGSIFVAKDGQSFLLLYGADGKPARAVIGTTILVFENYTDATVDIGILSSGQHWIVPEVPLGGVLAAPTSIAVTPLGGLSHPMGAAGDAALAFKIISGNMQIIACASKLAIGGIVGGPPGVAVAAVACAASVVSHLKDIGVPEIPALSASADAINNVATAVACSIGSVADCVVGALDKAADAAQAYDRVQTAESARLADEVRRSKVASVAGTWSGTGIEGRSTYPLTFILTQDRSSVTGSWSTTLKSGAITATLSGNAMTGQITSTGCGLSPFTATVSGRAMSGTVSPVGDCEDSVQFNLTKQ